MQQSLNNTIYSTLILFLPVWHPYQTIYLLSCVCVCLCLPHTLIYLIMTQLAKSVTYPAFFGLFKGGFFFISSLLDLLTAKLYFCYYSCCVENVSNMERSILFTRLPSPFSWGPNSGSRGYGAGKTASFELGEMKWVIC